jgi:DNA-binding NarL/FixJ family response regulator
MTTIRVLLGIPSPALARVVEHLVREHPGMEIVDRSDTAAALFRDAARTSPHLIVTSERFLGEAGSGLVDLKRRLPGAKLIVITGDDRWWSEEAAAGEPVADAAVEEEDLVRSLMPLIHTLAAGAR